jgi:hypothetical protein
MRTNRFQSAQPTRPPGNISASVGESGDSEEVVSDEVAAVKVTVMRGLYGRSTVLRRDAGTDDDSRLSSPGTAERAV